MTEPQPLLALRAKGWSGVPSSPGVYWWYFPRTELDRLRVAELCDVPRLQLRLALDGKVCLYHGMANNLAERLEWHAAQVVSDRRLLRQPFDCLAGRLTPVMRPRR